MTDSKYFNVVTDLGLSLIEDAYNNGTKVNITQMALGDSNGGYVAPDKTFTSLVNEFGREDIHESNHAEYLIYVYVYVSAEHAGNTVREFGLYDDLGNLIVYGAYPESLIPDEASSDYIQLEIEVRVDLVNAESVIVTVNPLYPQATETEAGIAKIIKEDEALEEDETEADDSKILTLYKLLKRKATDKLAGVTMLSHITNGSSKTKAASEYALGLVNAVATKIPKVEELQEKDGWFTNERTYLGQTSLTYNNLTLSHYTQTKSLDSTIERGYPTEVAGVLDVAHTASNQKTLTYKTYGTPRLFITHVSADTPDAPATNWVEFYSTNKMPTSTEDEFGVIKIINEQEVIEPDESKADDSKALTLYKLLKRKATDKLAGVTILSHITNGSSTTKAASEYALGLVKALAEKIPTVEELGEKAGWFTNSRQNLGQTSLSYNNLTLGHYTQTKTADSTIERGYPTGEAGVLDVAPTASTRKTLTYKTYNSKRLFVTYVSADTPDEPATDWVEFYSDKNPQSERGLGYNQSYYSTASTGEKNIIRDSNVLYTNDTDQPIFVNIAGYITNGSVTKHAFLVDGNIAYERSSNNDSQSNISAIVPPGATYMIDNSAYAVVSWSELRSEQVTRDVQLYHPTTVPELLPEDYVFLTEDEKSEVVARN